MLDKARFVCFWLFASFIAPFHFKPINCPVRNRCNCRIWNCELHYKDGLYADCQLISKDEGEKLTCSNKQ